VIFINVSESINIEANVGIDCRGATGTSGAGGGSGGSIWIITNTLSGNGYISADGGVGSSVENEDNVMFHGGGGSGGRIAIYYHHVSNFTGNITAMGGEGYYTGGPGTIYVYNTSSSTSLLQIKNMDPPANISDIPSLSSSFGQIAWIVEENEPVIQIDEIFIENAILAMGGAPGVSLFPFFLFLFFTLYIIYNN
jgi:hypothetical protein